jgi:hypothetical protein
MLKFENTAQVGDYIIAFDFQPMSDRPDSFVSGRVIDKGMFGGVPAYKVSVYEDSVFTDNPRLEVIVPFELSFMEYDTRVAKVGV